MKRYIMTAASVLMALTTFAQKELMVLVAESDSHETKVTFANRAEVSFWGQPQGEEQNGDLTITMTEVKGESASFVMQATNWKNLDKGFYIVEHDGKEEGSDVIYIETPEATYTEDCHFYSLDPVDFDENNRFTVTITGLKPHTTYDIKPYAISTKLFGSTKTFTTQWTIDALVAQDMFGSWYANAKVQDTQGVFIVPTAEAWSALCDKYPEIFGNEPSETVQQALTTEWFRHLTPAEVDLMKTYSVAYYDNCEDGEVYVVDRVCDEMIPNLLKAKADIDLTNPNLTYTKNCIVESVQCDESYGIESYVKTESQRNPRVGYDLPFMLLPNCIYNVSVTIAPNTEDIEDERPNKFAICVYKGGKSQKITNPQPTIEKQPDIFVYGGQKLENFTFQIDTHDEEFVPIDIIQFGASVLSTQREQYSNILRIAKVTISCDTDNTNVEDNYIDGVYFTFNMEDQTAEVTSGENKYTGEVIIPSSIIHNGVTNLVTTIGAESFSDCSELTSVSIPESVTSIGGYAFMNCIGLSFVTIPESVTSIEAGAFNCSGLTSVNIPYGVTSIGHNTFSCCYSLTSVTLPESLTSIDDYAFSWCNSLTSISIPSSITSLGEGVFYGCNGLTNVYCYPESVPETSAEIFNSVELGNATLHVPATLIDTYKAIEPWKNFGNIVALPEIVPMGEETEISFNDCVTENTDLTSKVIDNVYVTLNTEGNDGYDTEEKCVVLTSTVTEEQLEVISGKEVGEATVKENFNGLILEVPAGTGTVSIDAQTKGSRTLNIKMGTSAEQTFTQSERGVVEVSYTVEKDTYVYIYGAEKGNDARRRVSGVNAENGVLIYGIKWTGDTTDIDAVATANDATYQIYTIDGKQVDAMQKGVNIIRYPNGATKKVYVK